MKFSAIFYLLFLSTIVLAQQPLEDSLLNLANNPHASDEEKTMAWLKLAQSQFLQSSDQSLDYALKAFAIAEKNNYKSLLSASAKEIAKVYYRQSDLANALEYFKLALKINLEINNQDELAASYNNVGVIYNRLGYYTLALQNHLYQLKTNEILNNQRGIAVSYLNIGNIYNNLSENDKALDYYQRSREIYAELGDTNSYANTSINLGVTSMELKNYNQAEEYFNEALIIKQNMEDVSDIAAIYSNLGVINLIQNNLNQALEYFDKSMTQYSSVDNKHGIIVTGLNIGDVKMKMKLFDESYQYFFEALKIATSIDAKKLIQDAQMYLATWHKENNDYKTAYEYYESFTALKDSLFNIEKSHQIKNLQIVYEVEKKEKEILEQGIAIEQFKIRQVYLLLIILVIFTSVIVLYLRYRIKKKLNKQLEIKIAEAIKKQNEQQQVIVHQSSLTSLGELASGIAHEIKQPLQNISLSTESIQLENKESDPDRGFINNTISDIHEDIKRIKLIINEISKFSRGQQLQIEERFNINQCIDKAFILARTKFSDYQINVEFELDRSIPEITGNPYKFEQVVVNLYNNAKDAIEERAAKTGNPFEKLMRVKSYISKGFINVEVIDNGIGIPDELKTNIFLPFYTTKNLGKGTGLGLSISVGIAKEMGGFIEFESAEMQGTCMRLKIPLPEKNQE
ncbi:MAG: sensor histidine kinase [Sphingobacteriia bacterium]|nr:sensor histidine kinase [Sphingobacteriia bacterium]